MEAPKLSLMEEDLTEMKKDTLENLCVYLCEKIIAERHFDHLSAKKKKKILSREDTEEISCRTSSRKGAGKLLDYLQENLKGLDTLVESILREKTQNFLIQKITDEVLKLQYKTGVPQRPAVQQLEPPATFLGPIQMRAISLKSREHPVSCAVRKESPALLPSSLLSLP